MKTAVLFILLVFNLIFSISTNLYAQESAPSLSIGLDEVLFNKGQLDVELITKMIADKQEELKLRIVEQEILNPALENSSFATANYLYSSVKVLLNEKDKNVIKKKLMEHTVNYAMVYTIAEMYAQLSWNLFKTNDGGVAFNRLINQKSDSICIFNGEVSNENLKSKLSQLRSLTLISSPKDKELELNEIIMDAVFEAVLKNPKLQSKGFMKNALHFDLETYKKLSKLQAITNPQLRNSILKNVEKFVNDIAMLYESFEELRKIITSPSNNNSIDFFNKKLGEKLVANTQKIAETQKFIFSKSLAELEDSSDKHKNGINQLEGTHKYLVQQREYLGQQKKLAEKELIDMAFELLKKYDTINAFKTKESLSVDFIKSCVYKDSFNVVIKEINLIDSTQVVLLNRISEIEKKIKDGNGTLAQLDAILVGFKNEQNKITILLEDVNKKRIDPTSIRNFILEQMEKELFSIASKDTLVLSPKWDSLILRLYSNYYFIKENFENSKNLDYLNWSKNTLLPELAFLNLKSGGKLKNIVLLTEALNTLIEYEIYSPIIKIWKDTSKLSYQFNRFFNNSQQFQSTFLQFFERLDQLNKTETYYYLLRDILQAGDAISDPNVSSSIRIILSSIEKYTHFNTNQDRIDINVEDIITALADKYGNRDKVPVFLYMTVGLNNSYAFKPNTLMDGNNETVNNLAFASEKIGLRWNLYNFELNRSYSYGEYRTKLCNNKKEYKKDKHYNSSEPLVKNIHLIAYGSGLLYKITDLGTSKNLNAVAFLGFGLGMSFYNNLNCNLSLNAPIYKDQPFKTGFQQPLISLGFDVLYLDYINELNKKRKIKKENEPK